MKVQDKHTVIVVWIRKPSEPLPNLFVFTFASPRDAFIWEGKLQAENLAFETMKAGEFRSKYNVDPAKGRWFLVKDNIGCTRMIGTGMTSQAILDYIKWYYPGGKDSKWSGETHAERTIRI